VAMRGRHVRSSAWVQKIRKWGLVEWSAIATILALPIAVIGLYANGSTKGSRDLPAVTAGSTTSSSQGVFSTTSSKSSSTTLEPTTTTRRPLKDLVSVVVESNPHALTVGEVYMSYVVPHSLQTVEARYPKGGSGPSGCPGRFRWWRAIGAVEAKSRFEVKLTGLTDTSIIQARARIIRRLPARKGIGLMCGPEGEVQVRNVVVELESPDRLYYVEGSEEENNFKRKPFILSLRKGEVEVLDIIATARAHYYEWVLELTITHRDQKYRFVVDDDGKPFRTSSATNASSIYTFDCGCPAPGVFTLRKVPKEDIECDPTSPLAVCA
jgi:hypothetical protein